MWPRRTLAINVLASREAQRGMEMLETIVIHNTSYPRRPHLWIRVLVCLWEVFLNRVNTILDRLEFGHKLINIGPECRLNGTRILH